MDLNIIVLVEIVKVCVLLFSINYLCKYFLGNLLFKII